jgi:hypothetical protein
MAGGYVSGNGCRRPFQRIGIAVEKDQCRPAGGGRAVEGGQRQAIVGLERHAPITRDGDRRRRRRRVD